MTSATRTNFVTVRTNRTSLVYSWYPAVNFAETALVVYTWVVAGSRRYLSEPP